MVKKNYMIQAHHNPKLLRRLISRLDDGFSKFFIHIDLKSDIQPFREMINGDHICFIEKRVDCIWADYSQVVATCNLMEAIINSNNRGVTIFLSGQDYPVKSNDFINHFLSNNKNDFISFQNFKLSPKTDLYRQRLKLFKINLSNKRDDLIILGNPKYMNVNNWKRIILMIIRGKFKLQFIPYFFKGRSQYFVDYSTGSNWFAIQYDTLVTIHKYITENQDKLYSFFKYSFAVDEIFFQSIYFHLFNRIAKSDNLHYVNWDKKGVSLPLTFLKEDIHYISNLPDDRLFVRKFSEESEEVLDWIDQNLL